MGRWPDDDGGFTKLGSRARLALGLGLVAGFLGLLGTADRARAQVEEDDPFAGVEEMIVTGSSTAALLAPQSTSAVSFDNAQLEAYGVENIGDVASFVPNLEINSSNATNASLFIRGVGLQDFGANASSAVPIFQDGIVRNPSATQLVGLYDVSGLSVLRGPQGSRNFRNASAGAILLKTTKPSPEFSGYAQVTLASIVSDDAVDVPRYDVETALSTAVYEDIVSARLSARYSHENPFIQNSCANRVPLDQRVTAAFINDASAQLCETLTEVNRRGEVVGLDGETLRGGQASQVRPFLEKRLGEVDDYGFRAQLRIQPPDSTLDVVFRAEISNLNRDSVVGQHIGTGRQKLGDQDGAGYRDGDIVRRVLALEERGFGAEEVRSIVSRELRRRPLDVKPYSGAFDSPGRTIVETTAVSMNANMDIGDVATEFNFGFLDYRKSEDRDTDLSPNRVFPSSGNDQAWEVYADIAFTGESIGEFPLSWGAGAYTLLENVEAFQAQLLPAGFERENKFDQEIYSFGIFADAEYQFLESFTLSGGIRYNWERKDFEVQDKNETQFFTFIDQSTNQLTWDAITGFAEIRFDFTEEVATYLKYSRGFKAGHFNPSRPSSAQVPGVGFADPEKIDAFEWGIEFQAWASRISGTAALFHYNYKNYQVFRLTTTPVGVFREIQNADSARNFGAELEVVLQPLEGFVPEAIEGLRITFRGGWLETEFLEFTNVELRALAGFESPVTIDNTGNPLISAPNLKASLSVVWPFMIPKVGTVTPQYDLAWTDDVPYDPNRGRGQISGSGESLFEPYTIGNRAYALHHVRLSWEPEGAPGLRVSGWCRNVTDERFTDFAVDLTNFAGQQIHIVGDPRTCGADLRFTW